jgi:hypothetical protein
MKADKKLAHFRIKFAVCVHCNNNRHHPPPLKKERKKKKEKKKISRNRPSISITKKNMQTKLS